MTGSESKRRVARRAAQGAAFAARTPKVAATITVALAILGAGPAVAAAQARLQAPARVAAAPAKVRYYVVPQPGHGPVPTLYSIAATTLGSGSLFIEIFNLNKGRLQPNGQRLENPRSVEPGWILLLPPDASGPGVHFGPLPTTAVGRGGGAGASGARGGGAGTMATARVADGHSGRGRATAPARAPAASPPAGGPATIAETVIGGALLIFAVAGLGLVLRRRRAGGGHPKPTHARDAGPGGDWVRSLATDTPGEAEGPGGAGAPGRPYADHPSWPASDPGRPVAAGYGQTAGADGPDWPYSDHPGWSANAPGGQLTPDHPSWPASDPGPPVTATVGYGEPADPDRAGWPYPDHPSWPAADLGRPAAGDDHPSWPATDPGGGWAGPGGPQARPGGPPPASPSPFTGGAGLPRRERLGPAPAPAVHHDPAAGHAVAQVPPARGRHVRVPAGYSGPGGTGGTTPQRWSAQLARSTGPIPQTYYDLDFGDGRLQVMLTETPGADTGWAGPGGSNMLQLTTGADTGQRGPVGWQGADTGQRGPVGWQGADPGGADSVRLAQRILADADQQAAEIRLEASAQAVAIREAAEREAARIREQTAAEAAPIREGAEREAAEIRELAAAQAVAIREAAEREAAALRAHLLAMSAELARVAAYVTENLASPPQPGVRTISVPVLEPVAEPEAVPAAEPAARPAARPATAPRTRPVTRPATKPAAKPKTRQYKAMRRISVAAAALLLFVAVSGATEIGLHGYKFFVFRSAGTGATNGTSLQENQGPGQPDAPGTHHPKAEHRSTTHDSKGRSHGKASHGAKAQHGAKASHGKGAQKNKGARKK